MSEQSIEDLESRTNGSTDVGQQFAESAGDYYRKMMEFSADAIISIDEQGIIESFNKAAENLFGYTKEEAAGQNISMLMPGPHRENHDQYLANYRSTGEAKILGSWREVEGRRKDGTKVPIEIGIREFWVGERRVFAGIVRDLTQLKHALEEIKRRGLDVLELSTPVISVWEGVLILPLIGTLDSRRMQICTERALTRLSESDSRVLILDVTGVPVIDTMVANHLVSLAASVRLMGGESVVTGISPMIAMTIIGLGLDLSVLNTRGTLQDGLKLAIELAEKWQRD